MGILGLFFLDHDRKVVTSKTLWIPVLWLLIAGSRNVGEWLESGPPTAGADPYLDGSPVDRNVLSALIVLGIIVLVRRRRELVPVLRSNIPILLYFFYCGVSIFWSDYSYVASKRWVRAVGDLVMVLIVLTEVDVSGALNRVIARVGFVLLPTSILFIRYHPELGRRFSRWDGTMAWCGVTTSKNELGMICMILGLGSAWRFWAAYRRRKGWCRTRQLIARGAILAMVLGLMSKANSATSAACFLVAGGVMALTSRAAVACKSTLVHLLVVAAVSCSLYALFFDTGGVLVGTLGRNATLTGRTDVWRKVVGFVDNPIVGTGYESFWIGDRLERMRTFDPDLNQAHNGYLEVYLNLGWVGIALIALVMIRGEGKIVHALFRDPDVGSLRLAYFVVGVIYNCTEAAIKMRSPVWIFFLLAVCAIPRSRVTKHGSAIANPAQLFRSDQVGCGLTNEVPTAVSHQ